MTILESYPAKLTGKRRNQVQEFLEEIGMNIEKMSDCKIVRIENKYCLQLHFGAISFLLFNKWSILKYPSVSVELMNHGWKQKSAGISHVKMARNSCYGYMELESSWNGGSSYSTKWDENGEWDQIDVHDYITGTVMAHNWKDKFPVLS